MIIVATVALSTMISNDLVMPVLLRAARSCDISQRRDLPRLILIDPPRGDPAPAAAGLRLLPAGRRVFPAGQHRPDLVLRRRPVRAADPGRPLLEGGQSRRRHAGPVRRRRGLALHAGPADPGDGRPGRRRLRRATARSASRCCARRRCWAWTASGPVSHAVVWSLGRQPQPRRAVRPARPAEQSRAAAGGAVRRCRPAAAAWASCGAARPGRGAARAADPLPRPGAGRHGLRHGPAPARPGAGARRRGRRDAGPAGRAPAGARHRLGQCPGDGGLGGARRGHRPRRSDADPGRDLAGDRVQPAAGAEVGRRSSRPPPSCARPTSGCASSTSSRTTSWPRSATSCARP